MTRPADPYVVRRLADCIELLPMHINNKMPFVQEVVRRALEQIRFDREALARGHEALAQGDGVEGQLRKGKKYRYELGGEPLQAEKYREPVTSVWLSDSDKEALKDGFEEDETGIFEFFERHAADIGEWLKEFRHPRDAERFRSRFSFVCGEALLYSQGVEVSPGVYKLDLGHWETEVAKPLCDDLRQFADEMADDPSAYAMRFDGQHWHINYGSEKGFVNASKGAEYVAQLLGRPGIPIPCQVLHNSAERSLTRNDPTTSKNDAVEELARLRVDLAELRQRMENKPHEVLPEDQNDEQGILDRIKQLTGLGGKPRQKGAADNARTAVYSAIQRFYGDCRKKKLNAFVDHLELKLETGSNPVYSGPFEWKISRSNPTSQCDA